LMKPTIFFAIDSSLRVMTPGQSTRLPGVTDSIFYRAESKGAKLDAN
jgi:hypothetical protein